MKKILCLILAFTFLLASCAQRSTQPPEEPPESTSDYVSGDMPEAATTVTTTEPVTTTAEPITTVTTTTQKPHECERICGNCGLCLDSECNEDVCVNKCSGHQETPYEFSYVDGFITDKRISIDTGKIVYDIEKGIYVPGHIEELINVVVPIMEEITGHSFDGVKNYGGKLFFDDKKTHVHVSRENLYAEMDWYEGLKTNELGSAYASASGHVEVAPGDILDCSTITHELGHVLMFRQAEWSYGVMLNEGYTEYTLYRVAEEMKKNHPEYLYYFDIIPECQINNLIVMSYNEMYKEPITHWIDNSFEHAFNNSYAIGFRFMWYLDEVYGDYTKWVDEAEKLYPYDKHTMYTDILDTDKIIEVVKSAYGDDVWDNFYDWMKKNKSKFESVRSSQLDLADVNEVNLYPSFDAIESELSFSVSYINGLYNYEDLYINLEPARTYLEEYKGLDASNLVLKIDSNAKINLYRQDGSFETVSNTRGSVKLSEDICYIKLVGKGSFRNLYITGFM